MSALRYSRVWYLVGGVLTLIVIVTSLMPARDLPHVGLSDKAEHLISYAGLALWFGGLIEPRRFVKLALALLVLGGAMEIAQGLMGMGREADWLDFRADALGAVLGLSLCLAGFRHWANWLEQWLNRR